MTDREMLEWAAKSIGDHAEEYDEKRGVWLANARVWWNPRDDDGDAFRLAVKLRLLLHIWDNKNVVVVSPGNNAVEFTDDPYAATRRAIVRAAAKIGRNLT